MNLQQTQTASERSIEQRELIDWAALIGGTLLTLWGLRQWSVSGILATASGVGLIAFYLNRGDRARLAPSKQRNSPRRPVHENHWVDEASSESFPASDPPAVY